MPLVIIYIYIYLTGFSIARAVVFSFTGVVVGFSITGAVVTGAVGFSLLAVVQIHQGRSIITGFVDYILDIPFLL